MSEESGGKLPINNWTLVLPVGALTLLGALMLSVSNEASVALKIAEQHGEQLLRIQQQIDLLRTEQKDNFKSRYTSLDAQRDLEYIKRDIAELKIAVKELNK